MLCNGILIFKTSLISKIFTFVNKADEIVRKGNKTTKQKIFRKILPFKSIIMYNLTQEGCE